MNKRKYFYLISGLPDISLQDEHLPFSTNYFLDELTNALDKNDFELVCILYYARDNRNLLDMLFNKKGMMHSEGRYSLQALEKGAAGNFPLPPYMDAFIAAFKENKDRYTAAEWEAKLTEGYFREAMHSGNTFLDEWMEFELNLKKLLLVTGNRKQALPFADFSTESSADFINQVVNNLATENFIDCEKKIDALRWKKLEEMSFFDYFTVEAILSYTIRLMIIERWIKLLPGQGKAFLPSILNSIMKKNSIPIAENQA